MGTKNSVEALGAEGKKDIFFFDPTKLTVVTDKEHPLYDDTVEDAISEERIVDFFDNGVHTPITVRKNQAASNGVPCTEVVIGRDRVRGLIIANERRVAAGLEPHKIRAQVTRASYDECQDLIVAENVARRQMTPMRLAKYARRLLASGRSKERVASVMNCTTRTIENYVAVTECSAAVQRAVEKGLPMTEAKKLRDLPVDEQNVALENLMDGDEKPKKGKAARKAVETATGKVSKRARSYKELKAALKALKSHEGADDFAGWIDGIRFAMGENVRNICRVIEEPENK